MNSKNRQQAIRLVERVQRLAGEDPIVAPEAQRLWESLQLLPMDKILVLVPGDTVTDRARTLGVSRECYYNWLRGRRRPDKNSAQKLSEITGVPATAIMGAR